jgi:hypothetical protein
MRRTELQLIGVEQPGGGVIARLARRCAHQLAGVVVA